VALREAKTLLGVFGRRGLSILVRPALCLERPFGPAAALGSGLLLMSMLFYTMRQDWKQPTTCLCVPAMNSLLYNNKDPCASVWRRSSRSARSLKRKLLSSESLAPSHLVISHTIAPFNAFSTKQYTSGRSMYPCLHGTMSACTKYPSHDRGGSGTKAPQDSCKPNRNLGQPATHLDPSRFVATLL
jgi:hypothetical protein